MITIYLYSSRSTPVTSQENSVDDWSWVNIRNQTGQLSTWSSSGNPTPVPFLSEEVLHGLINRQPYTGSFSTSDVVLHELIIRQPYTGSFSIFRRSLTRTYHQSNPTPVPFLSEEVLHGLISRWPYPGSSRSFTRTYPAVTLPRFLQKSYTDLSQDDLTPVHPEVLHELIL